MEHTKGEAEFLNALMSAWAGGWYAGRDGETSDDRKRADCPEIMKRYPKQAAAIDLLEACKEGKARIEFLQRQIGLQEKDIQHLVPAVDVRKTVDCIGFMAAAIAKAKQS